MLGSQREKATGGQKRPPSLVFVCKHLLSGTRKRYLRTPSIGVDIQVGALRTLSARCKLHAYRTGAVRAHRAAGIRLAERRDAAAQRSNRDGRHLEISLPHVGDRKGFDGRDALGDRPEGKGDRCNEGPPWTAWLTVTVLVPMVIVPVRAGPGLVETKKVTVPLPFLPRGGGMIQGTLVDALREQVLEACTEKRGCRHV